MSKKRIALVLLLLIVFGDHLVFGIEKKFNTNTNCGNFNSVVRLENNGFGTGVYMGGRSILTANHVAEREGLAIVTADGNADANIMSHIAYEGLDLAMVYTDKPLDIPAATLAKDNKWQPPYELVSIEGGVLRRFAGYHYLYFGDEIIFRNDVAHGGNSGGPLLNKHCELAGIARAASIGPLKGVVYLSIYTNILDPKVQEWILQNYR